MLQLREKREYGIPRRDTGAEKEWSGTIDNSAVIVLIQALGDAKIANKWIMNTHSHSDLSPNIE